MNRSPFAGLRVRLLSIVLLALVPALGFAVYTSLEQRRLAAQEVKENALQVVRVLAAEHEELLEGAREVLLVLGEIPEVRGRDSERCAALLADFLRAFRRYANFGVIRADGRLFCSALPGDSALELGDRSYFQRAVHTKDLVVGDYQIGRITHRATVNFAYPILDASGSVTRVVYAALDLSWLGETVARARLPEGSTLTLTDSLGVVLMRYPDPGTWVGATVVETPVWASILVHRGSGTTEGVGLDGKERLFAFTSLDGDMTGGEIHLAISIPEDVAFASVDRLLAPNLIAFALFALLAALAAGAAAEVLVLQPVNALLTATQRLAAGDLRARSEVRHRRGELAELASAFDEMAGRLEESIQEHERSEGELREANEALRALFGASPLTVLALDRDGCVRTWNPAAERMFGWSEAEVLGRQPPFVPADRRQEFEDHLRRLFAGEPLAGAEAVRVRRDGTPIDVRIWAGPLHGADGAIEGVMAVVEDITEWKRLEQQFRQSQKMEAVGRLAGGVAHDFNNLLTAILGYADLVLQDDGAHTRREGVEEIKRAAERAALLTRQLLAFSRQQILEPKVLDLNEVVLQMDKLLRRLIGEDIELVTVLEPKLGRVRADAGQIEQIVMNLAVNARDAMPEGGTLTIETANVDLDEAYARRHVAVVPGPYVMVAISDTGVGMDAETQTHLFEPFFTTKEVGRGTGLGLSTVYGIVKQSEGNIWVYSEPGRGTTFKIYLPRVEASPDVKRELAVPAGLPRGTETVLVAEDESLVRTLVTRVLRQCGYDVIEATDAQEALRRAEAHAGSIDLLVTDLVMPEMGGRELAERLTAARPGLRVLYMSGYTDRGVTRQRGFEPGAAFLEKPFTPQTLAARVRAALDAD